MTLWGASYNDPESWVSSQIRCGFHLWQSSELLTNAGVMEYATRGRCSALTVRVSAGSSVCVWEWHPGNTPVKVGPASNRPLPLQSKDHFMFPLLAFHPPCQNGKATSFSTREMPNAYSCTSLCLPRFPVCALVTEKRVVPPQQEILAHRLNVFPKHYAVFHIADVYPGLRGWLPLGLL